MLDALAVRDEFRLQQWAAIIQECDSSGLTNREFCQQRGINEKSFYYWLRKLRTRLANSTAPQLVPLEQPQTAEDEFRIQYRGADLRLPVGVDMDAVATLLRSIQSL